MATTGAEPMISSRKVTRSLLLTKILYVTPSLQLTTMSSWKKQRLHSDEELNSDLPCHLAGSYYFFLASDLIGVPAWSDTLSDLQAIQITTTEIKLKIHPQYGWYVFPLTIREFGALEHVQLFFQ